jgi:rubrerythrin
MGLPLSFVILELEREGYRLFNESSKRTQSQQSKELFLQMLQMERDHRELLDSSVASLGKSEHFDAGQWRSSHGA